MGKISDALEKAKKRDTQEYQNSAEASRNSSLKSEGQESGIESSAATSHESNDHNAEEAIGVGSAMQVEAATEEVRETQADPGRDADQDKRDERSADQSTAKDKWDERLYQAVNEDIYLPEIFKALRSRILLPDEHESVPKSIMITSVEPKEGKSFVAANLGVSLAQGLDQHCLIVNCDLRRPSISSLFGLPGDVGLADYLRGEKEIDHLIQKTTIPKLSIISSGGIPKNPAELLSSARMGELLVELAQRYEDRIVIYDCPPFQFVPETTVLAKLVDKIILVVRHAGAGRYELKKLIDKLGREKFLGVVFNGHQANIIDRSLMKGYSSYASSYYAGAYER